MGKQWERLPCKSVEMVVQDNAWVTKGPAKKEGRVSEFQQLYWWTSGQRLLFLLTAPFLMPSVA